MLKLCSRLKHDEVTRKARLKIDNELNVVKLIKNIRYFRTALAVLLPKEDRKLLRLQAKYTVIKGKNKSANDEKDDYHESSVSSDFPDEDDDFKGGTIFLEKLT